MGAVWAEVFGVIPVSLPEGRDGVADFALQLGTFFAVVEIEVIVGSAAGVAERIFGDGVLFISDGDGFQRAAAGALELFEQLFVV